ncbi:hypothetical protein T492DRAFT_970556 [Pavlovales sp. CCMP2436]|nr:hypothetical protein T492DRAFT_970556 [Pavlovales sp. CCMP2436]
MRAGIQKLQHAITAQTEEIDAMPRPRSREAIVYRTVDEYSRAFLTVLPGGKQTNMCPAEFRECYVRYIAGKSSACPLDAYGDIAVAAAWTGNQESIFRHDPIDVGGYAVAEDSASFSSVLLPSAIAAAQAQAALTGQTHRLRVITPDVVVRVDPARGRLQLIKVKTNAFCPSYYTDNNVALPPGLVPRTGYSASRYPAPT